MAKIIEYEKVLEIVQEKCPNIKPELVIMPDVKYFVLGRDWLFDDFKAYYTNKMWKLGHWKIGYGIWKKDFDCDKFSRGYAWYASVCHGEALHSISEGLAVGELYYYIKGDKSQGHAINCAIVDDYEMIFIEPQTAGEVELSDKELESIDFVKF